MEHKTHFLLNWRQYESSTLIVNIRLSLNKKFLEIRKNTQLVLAVKATQNCASQSCNKDEAEINNKISAQIGNKLVLKGPTQRVLPSEMQLSSFVIHTA